AASANVIQGNLIGTSITGISALRNSGAGIQIFFAPGTIVGGTAAGAGNVVGGNGSAGIVVTGCSGTLVQGNAIRVGVDAITPVPNAKDGVWLSSGAAGATIGGGAGNVVAYNHGNGVLVAADAGTGNTISANAIFANDGLGIDLGIAGTTANDPGDADTG